MHSPHPSALMVALRLGRVSNLPTVWTNVLAAATLAGSGRRPEHGLTTALAMSLLYVGGMYLNDAFDREWDRARRPERPIPAGRVSAGTVFGAGFALLALGVGIMAGLALASTSASPWAALTALGTAGLIVLYDAHHKDVSLSPLAMGLTRVGVYLCAGFTVGEIHAQLWPAAGAVLCHVIGLSYVAKHETAPRLVRLWPVGFLALPLAYAGWLVLQSPHPIAVGAASWLLYAAASLYALTRVPGFGSRPNPAVAVPLLIANLSLLDAVFLATLGRAPLAVTCGLLWALTLLLQRKVPGT